MEYRLKIKLRPSDIAFSRYIRIRDQWTCQRPQCGSVRVGGQQASHYFGRARESTRFDPQNCDTLCAACHRFWGSDDREAYRNFKIRQLGQAGFDRLVLKSNQYCKRDDVLDLMLAKQLLKQEEEKI